MFPSQFYVSRMHNECTNVALSNGRLFFHIFELYSGSCHLNQQLCPIWSLYCETSNLSLEFRRKTLAEENWIIITESFQHLRRTTAERRNFNYLLYLLKHCPGFFINAVFTWNIWIVNGSSFFHQEVQQSITFSCKKGGPYSITKRGVPELIPVLGSQPVGDVSHKPGGRLPLLSTRPAVTSATLKRVATNFTAWWTEAQWVWTVCLRLLPDSVAAAIWIRAFCAWVQHANHLATEPPFSCTWF